jgi:uncharacterized protein (TIGR00369 family)
MDQARKAPAGGFRVEIPFAEHLGVRLVERGEGTARTELDLVPHQCNSFGAAHGGVLMALLDVTMAMAARSRPHHPDDDRGAVVTIEMKTSFLQPGQGRLAGHGRCVHRTRTMAFCEADVVDAAGRLVARASGTFKHLRLRKAGP